MKPRPVWRARIPREVLEILDCRSGLMLREILDPRAMTGPRLLLGDFNEWFNGAASRLLRREFGDPCGRRRSLRTHPSPLPVFPLDRIYHNTDPRTIPLDSSHGRTQVTIDGLHSVRAAAGRLVGEAFVPIVRLPGLPPL